MKALFLAIASVVVLFSAGLAAQAQPATTATQQTADPGVTANGAIGEVKVIDAAAKHLILKTDAGTLVTVALADSTVYMRLAPGEKTLTNATKIAFTDVGEGDRVWARGKVSEDHKNVPATALIVMNKVDIAKKQEAERAEWKRRGMLGMITALKPESKEITVSSRSMAGMQAVIIPISDKVEMRRYAPDSIKFADAKPAKFEELKVGDQVRALGEKSPDGTAFTAEKVVTGAFKTVGGVVTAIDAATGEVKINDLQTKQPLTIVIKQDAVLRKFPAMGEGGMMVMGGPGGASGPGGARPAGAPVGGPGAQGAGPGGPRPGGAQMNIQDMLEKLPTIALADLKVGDTIIVSSTKGADPTRLTAISLISGADTLLNIMAARQPQGGPSTPNPSAGLGSGIQFGIGLP
jgi:Ni2+-binding GTPase involved in maturation of urease and hydrogenase